MARQRPYRAALIGAGAIAQACHAPGYARRSDVELVAFADPVLARHEEMAAAYPDVQAYSDYHAMLTDVKPEVVSICTPNVHHCRATLRALEAKAHVLCEKPIAMTLREAEQMIDAAAAVRRKLMVGFTHRLFAGPMRAKALLEGGAIGRPFMIRVRFAHGGPYPGWAKDDWFYKPVQAGGGALFDMGIHAIDLCHWLVGPISTVQARCATLAKDIAVEDNAVLLLEFTGGEALGYIECGWTSRPGFSGFELYGSEGTIICDYREGLARLRGEDRPDGTEDAQWEVVEPDPTAGGWDTEIDYWIDVVAGRTQNTLDGLAGREALAVALAAYTSDRTGRRTQVR